LQVHYYFYFKIQCMRPFIPILLTFFLIVGSWLYVPAQEKKFTVSYTVSLMPSNKYIKKLDSVKLRNEITGVDMVLYNQQSSDGIFKFQDVPLGKYRLIVFQNPLVIKYVDFAACSLCKNIVNLLAYKSVSNIVVGNLKITAFYTGGFKQLATDFLSGITPEEKKILKKTDNKLKVKCFITADQKLSDVVFDQADLPDDIKRIILKGFEKTKSWIAALNNGKPGDDYMPVAVSKLVD
jgi:hypothetical protein